MYKAESLRHDHTRDDVAANEKGLFMRGHQNINTNKKEH
jgi:hypothetical protein